MVGSNKVSIGSSAISLFLYNNTKSGRNEKVGLRKTMVLRIRKHSKKREYK